MSLQQFYKRHTVPLTLLLLIIGALLLSMLIVSERTQSYRVAVETQLQSQVTYLQELAVSVAQNRPQRADVLPITGCPSNQKVTFDALLSQLDSGLSQSELLELEQLFNACAHTQVERKGLAVTQLDREIELLASYAALLSALNGSDVADDYNLPLWEQLGSHEAAQREAMSELVIAQKEIIDTLLAGKSADSPEMVTILNKVAQTQEQLMTANTQATNVRTQLSS